MDARIRDDNSIRTTNAKLTIESLKNLAKERDLMIDKRMNEKRYASGGTVNFAQGDEVYSPPEPFRGEFFEEFLRGRGGREAFQEGDFLEGLLAKIGGGRTRTQDEMIYDTYESYKLGLRDSDSLDDNLRYQAIIEDEEKRKSTTPTVDSDLDKVSEAEQFLADDFSDGLGKSVERIPDPNAETFVPKGAVDLEVDPSLEVDLTPEGVDIGAAGLEIVNTPVTLPKPIQPVTLDQELIDPTTYATDLMDAYGDYSEADRIRLDKQRDLIQRRITEGAEKHPDTAKEVGDITKRFLDNTREGNQHILNTLKDELSRTEASGEVSNLRGDQQSKDVEQSGSQRSIKIDPKTGELKPADWVPPTPTPPRLKERSPKEREGEIDLQEVIGKDFKPVPQNVAPADLKPSIAGSPPPQVETQPEPGSLPLGPSPFEGMTRVFEKVSQAVPDVQKNLYKKSRFNMKNLDKFNKNASPEDVVAQFEKFKGNSYFATKFEEKQGISTVGYGDTQSNKTSVTKEEAKADLAKRLKKVGEDVDKLIKVPLSPNQRTAIISLVDNVGLGAFSRSMALQALNDGDFEEFHNQAFSFENGFVNQNGKPLKGLVRRRASEGNLFNLA
jgi:GH24 family phage-related lysozyme (muramidase)